jgi:hypothetical protein
MSDNGGQFMKTWTEIEHLDALRRPSFIVLGSAIFTQQMTKNVLSRAGLKHLNHGYCNQWRVWYLEIGFYERF